MMQELTRTQQTVLDLIKRHVAKHGRPPTIREIQTNRGYKSPNAVACHLRALERRGKIKRAANQSRAIEILDRPPSGIPVMGEVS
jgi:repressor LexA